MTRHCRIKEQYSRLLPGPRSHRARSGSCAKAVKSLRLRGDPSRGWLGPLDSSAHPKLQPFNGSPPLTVETLFGGPSSRNQRLVLAGELPFFPPISLSLSLFLFSSLSQPPSRSFLGFSTSVLLSFREILISLGWFVLKVFLRLLEPDQVSASLSSCLSYSASRSHALCLQLPFAFHWQSGEHESCSSAREVLWILESAKSHAARRGCRGGETNDVDICWRDGLWRDLIVSHVVQRGKPSSSFHSVFTELCWISLARRIATLTR